MPATTIKRSAANIIAFHFSADMAEVSDTVYQPTRYNAPRIYGYAPKGFEYVCCPSRNQKPPKGFKWEKIGEEYGRAIYAATGDIAEDAV